MKNKDDKEFDFIGCDFGAVEARMLAYYDAVDDMINRMREDMVRSLSPVRSQFDEFPTFGYLTKDELSTSAMINRCGDGKHDDGQAATDKYKSSFANANGEKWNKKHGRR